MQSQFLRNAHQRRLTILLVRAKNVSDSVLWPKNLASPIVCIFSDLSRTLSRYLKVFDIFLLPSLKEGMPYVLLEADRGRATDHCHYASR